jgi:hypothetical protein
MISQGESQGGIKKEWKINVTHLPNNGKEHEEEEKEGPIKW